MPFFCHDSMSSAIQAALAQRSLSQVRVGGPQSPAYFNKEAPAWAPYVIMLISSRFDIMGMVLDGISRRLGYTSRHLRRLWYALTKLLHMPRAAGDALRAWMGISVTISVNFTQTLSVLAEIFPWSLQHLERIDPSPHWLQLELRVARCSA